ncbi:serine protease [Nocardioides marinquilinus]|uniref:Serine protease n=1 Tax=Nocardioides marinquilinus TaxID=1210400 RepID=A0ABP9P4D8_9ACTN
MRRGALVLTILMAMTVLVGVPAATAGPDTTPPPPRPDYRGAVSMKICSGSIVRFAGSRDTDRALALTNGHCHGKRLPEPDVVLGEQPARRPVALLDRSGEKVGSVLTDRLLFATMEHTDVALYRLRVTYRGLRERYGVRPLELATRRAARNTPITIRAGLNRIEYRCGLQGFSYRLVEGDYTWQWSLRYRTGACRTVGGTSGAPVLDPQRRVVGVNNTGTIEGYSGCELGAPCEVSRDGDVRSFPRRSYGQQTWQLTTCLDAEQRLFDATRRGCRLPDVT